MPVQPKTAIRFLNDTLFISNIGSVLVSISRIDTLPSYTWTMAAQVAFFILFRIKAYLDDNDSLIKSENDVNAGANGKVTWVEVFSAMQMILGWFFYTTSGYFFFTDRGTAFLHLMVAFAIPTIWILVETLAARKMKNYHVPYFVTNVLYMCLLWFGHRSMDGTQGTLNTAVSFGLVTVLLVDIWWSKSHTKLYR